MKRSYLLAGIAAAAFANSANAATCAQSFDNTSASVQVICGQPSSDPVKLNTPNYTTVDVTVGSGIAGGKKSAISITKKVKNTSVNITNSGSITSKKRGVLNESPRGANMSVQLSNDGLIETGKEAVLSGIKSSGVTVRNGQGGTLRSTGARALRLRAHDSSVENYGIIEGTKEVIEARAGFALNNYGTIRLIGGADDEDAVQFATGTVYNTGHIEGTDDGLDVDEASIWNSGTILSTGTNAAGIDVDPKVEDGINPDRASASLFVKNEGGLIEGNTGILTEAIQGTVNTVVIENGGTIRGRGGNAVDLTRMKGAATVRLLDNGVFDGDVRFGAFDDVFGIYSKVAGTPISGVVDGGKGYDTVDIQYSLTNLLGFKQENAGYRLSLDTGNGEMMSAVFRNFERFFFYNDQKAYTAAQLTARFAGTVSAVPLPAGALLLLSGFGGLAALRRRKQR